MIEITTPAGFENFFRELSGIFSANGPPDLEQSLTDKHNLRLIGT